MQLLSLFYLTQRHAVFFFLSLSDAVVVKCSFTSHTGWVVGVSWSPTHEHLFLSGSYDTVLKLWDTRRQVDSKSLIARSPFSVTVVALYASDYLFQGRDFLFYFLKSLVPACLVALYAFSIVIAYFFAFLLLWR